jgi:hypothetical protein
MRIMGTSCALAVLLVGRIGIAAPQDPDAGAADAKEDALGALDKEPGFEVGARLGAEWRLQDGAARPRNEFKVSAARLEIGWTQWKLVEASVSIEARHLVDGEGDFSILRDLFVRVQPLYWLGLRMGQFKKPFSRIELMGRGKLPLVDRGMANDYLTEHLMYGDRDIGAMLEGRLVKSIKLDYSIGVFNGMGENAAEISSAGTKDVAARLEAKPARWLSIGVNGSLKIIDEDDLPGFVDRDNFAAVDLEEYPAGYTDADFIREHGWMAGPRWMSGADFALKLGKFRAIAEGMFGEDWWFEKYPYAWSAALTVSYRIRLHHAWPLWLEPAARGEALSLLTDGGEWRTRMWQVAPGISLDIGKHVRLMIDGELTFTEGSESDIDGSRREGLWPNEWPGAFADSKRLLVQLVFSI